MFPTADDTERFLDWYADRYGVADTSHLELYRADLELEEIAKNFGQVFIVSHVDGLQKEFDHRIKMEDGRIVEKELEA